MNSFSAICIAYLVGMGAVRIRCYGIELIYVNSVANPYREEYNGARLCELGCVSSVDRVVGVPVCYDDQHLKRLNT